MDDFSFISSPASLGRPQPGGDVCLIVGCAPCWKVDVDAALATYPGADVCVINSAARLMPAQHIASVHGALLGDFAAMQKQFGKNPALHTRREEVAPGLPHYYWTVPIVKSSAPFAAAIMAFIGYKTVIMCGCPMDGVGDYAPEVKATRKLQVWNGKRKRSLEHYQNSMREFKQARPELAARIRSMSGATKEIFGGL